MAKRLSVRAERVIALVMATSLLLLTCSCSVTIVQQNSIEMKKQKFQSFPNTLNVKFGVKKDPKSNTIQAQAQSIKDMIRNHVQGTLDPSEYNEGLYDDENIDHETNVEDRSQRTLLDALDYANDNAMSKDQIQDYVDTFGTPTELEVQTEEESLKTPLNEAEQNEPNASE